MFLTFQGSKIQKNWKEKTIEEKRLYKGHIEVTILKRYDEYRL